MPNPNQAIIPGVLPGEPVPENEDLQPGQKPHFGERDPDSKDGMPIALTCRSRYQATFRSSPSRNGRQSIAGLFPCALMRQALANSIRELNDRRSI
jgi:hypothetical protein